MNKSRMIAISALLILTVSLFASCKKIDEDRVYSKVKSFAGAVTELNADKLMNASEIIDDKAAKSVIKKLSMDNMDDKEKRIKKAIAGTIRYNIGKKTITEDKSNGTIHCYVTFTMVDYRKILENDEYKDPDSMVRAIKQSDQTKDYFIDCTLIIEDDEYLISDDTIGELSDLYSFIDEEIKFPLTPAEINNLVNNSSWIGCDERDGHYTNTDKLELVIYFNEDPDTDYYYTVSIGSREIYRSLVLHTQGAKARAVYGTEQGAKMDGEYLAGGSYVVNVFLKETDAYLMRGYTDVTVVKPVTTPVPAPKSAEFEDACSFMKTLLGQNATAAKRMIKEHFGIKLTEKNRFANSDSLITEPYCQIVYGCSVVIDGMAFDEIAVDYIESNNYVYSISFHNTRADDVTNRQIFRDCSSKLYGLYGTIISSYDETTFNSYTFRSDDGFSFWTCCADWGSDGNMIAYLSVYNINDGYHTDSYIE